VLSDLLKLLQKLKEEVGDLTFSFYILSVEPFIEMMLVQQN
jgi:hypothetical protein